MSYDVQLQGTTMAALVVAASDHPFYSGDATQLVYQNPATQTAWTIEPGDGAPSARLNVPRGSWYAHEAALELAGLAAHLGLTLWSVEGKRTLDGFEPLREAVWEANAVARRTISDLGDTPFFHAPTSHGAHWWEWQSLVAAHQNELGEQGYVPQLLWFVDAESKRAALGFVWPEGQPQVFPPADAVIAHDPHGGDLLLPYTVVMQALESLVDVHEFSDGVTVPIVRQDSEDACRAAWRAAFAEESRFPSVAASGIKIAPPTVVLDDLEA
jgi:hypothetical protein